MGRKCRCEDSGIKVSVVCSGCHLRADKLSASADWELREGFQAADATHSKLHLTLEFTKPLSFNKLTPDRTVNRRDHFVSQVLGHQLFRFLCGGLYDSFHLFNSKIAQNGTNEDSIFWSNIRLNFALTVKNCTSTGLKMSPLRPVLELCEQS